MEGKQAPPAYRESRMRDFFSYEGIKTMELGMIQLLKMKQGVERILHVPGNYRGGILEMALIIDCGLEKEDALNSVQSVLKALKSHSEIFRNVRLNVIWWKSDAEIITEVIPIPVMQMGTPFKDYEQQNNPKTLDVLFQRLKLFQARSKVILMLSDGDFSIKDEESCMKSLKPFLGRKLLFMLEHTTEAFEKLLLKARMITVPV